MWDTRNWELSLKASNPVEAFKEYMAEKKTAQTSVTIDELPNKDWLRAT